MFTVPVTLHPEVKVDITVNIARTADEAKIQRETGVALIAVEEEDENTVEDETVAESEETTTEGTEAA